MCCIEEQKINLPIADWRYRNVNLGVLVVLEESAPFVKEDSKEYLRTS
jgi:hypothetical protein